MVNIVLYEPEIPPNTGNIARLCLATNSPLYLIEPLGFSLDDKHLKRAGLDYWQHVNYQLVPTIESLHKDFPNSNFYYLSTKATKLYTEITYKENDFLVFGPESRGLPENLIFSNDTGITIPMFNEKVRSINLATSVGIVLYEAIRQFN
ncbi:MAG: tRNA (cytidine(34)-2'-O)-methyltransferase [Candidatus Margulisbacteria bacterium]|nr:tRNA (cytidine(34)-2'-O)-methyltransferase [Candidatus Margulisiibacteriota bacterium]